MTEPTTQLFALKIEASGEVRDADGNLVENVPITSEIVLTEQELNQLIKEI